MVTTTGVEVRRAGPGLWECAACGQVVGMVRAGDWTEVVDLVECRAVEPGMPPRAGVGLMIHRCDDEEGRNDDQ